MIKLITRYFVVLYLVVMVFFAGIMLYLMFAPQPYLKVNPTYTWEMQKDSQVWPY